MRRLFICILALAAALPASAGAKTIHFQGEEVAVPAGWPVYRLAEDPRMCVRLDRRAVYLGTPGASQRCPANAIGRRQAILVDPGAEHAGASTRSRATQARISAAAEYTGLGFDACTAPSSATMRAWESSPYRAIGVYIGGINRGCSQPNLTASWVSAQTAAGWHLIPTYVGLQAPTSSCTSCATLSAGTAALQGAAAATDAVADAQAIGIGSGSPIYYDMESYSRTASSTNATLTFLGAWTTQLHALGYDSGVYSSSASGIADLVSRIGSIYPQPDDLWMANWNGQQNTLDPYVPASAWNQHQRIHQYRGGHNETWGGVTINIDNNYVEGATVGNSVPTEDDPTGSFDLVESPAPGQVRITGWAVDPNAPKKTVAIRAHLGGTAGQRSTRYELGAVATQERSDLFASFPQAGGAHGFDASFPVVGSGRQKVCVYAVNIGRGADALLGCRFTGVPLPVVITGIAATEKGTWVALRCDWPSGTECPGQILLRSRVTTRAPVRRKGRLVVRKKTAKLAIARRAFRLTGGGSHSFRVVLTGRGRELTRDREKLWAQLVVAIPGGQTTQAIRLR